MKLNLKKLMTCLMALAMLLSVMTGNVVAAEADDAQSGEYAAVTNEPVTVETDLPDNDELFAMYVEQKLYDSEWSVFGTAAAEGLSAAERIIYDGLKAAIEQVAENGGTTRFVLTDLEGLTTTWSADNTIGLDIMDGNAVGAVFASQYDMNNILSALLCDCPFDLYWFDKVEGGVRSGCQLSYSGYNDGVQNVYTDVSVASATFIFTVAQGYRGGNEETVTSDVSKVATAKTNAAAIVAENAGKSDYEKLLGYKNEICDLVSYNHNAVSDDYTGGYGDPWQLIYVFDGDAETDVVCEGYAKAFQYLCDLDGLDSRIVTGAMTGATGAGAHMWNVVSLEGSNYLVDVTNCDEGTIGAPDALFLVGGTSGSLASGYSYQILSQTVHFAYDSTTLSTWDESDLTLADADYEAPPAAYLRGTTITLDGTIGIHFYFEMDDALLASDTAVVRFTLGGKTTDVPVSEGVMKTVDENVYYGFTYHVYAKQMSDTVTAQVIMDEYSSEAFNYSIRDYAKVILANENELYTAEDIAMVKAMLNYGAYAQLNFGYNVTELANDVGTLMTESEKDVSSVSASDISAHKASGMEIPGLGTFYGANLVLESETTLKIYFEPAAGVDGASLDFFVGEEAVTQTQFGKYWVIAIPNIKAHELADQFVVKVTDGVTEGSFTCTVFSYGYSVLSAAEGVNSDELKTLIKALYRYNQTAVSYIGA